MTHNTIIAALVLLPVIAWAGFCIHAAHSVNDLYESETD